MIKNMYRNYAHISATDMMENDNCLRSAYNPEEPPESLIEHLTEQLLPLGIQPRGTPRDPHRSSNRVIRLCVRSRRACDRNTAHPHCIQANIRDGDLPGVLSGMEKQAHQDLSRILRALHRGPGRPQGTSTDAPPRRIRGTNAIIIKNIFPTWHIPPWKTGQRPQT